MERYKKRTIALIMASVITVAGAFGANNYKNSLMGLGIKSTSTNSVNIDLKTKLLYSGDLSLRRKDADTYVLILPETNSSATLPDITSVSPNISSVSINTMPYSNTANGYTKITVKTTNPNVVFSTTNSLFIPSADKSAIEDKRGATGYGTSAKNLDRRITNDDRHTSSQSERRNDLGKNSGGTITKKQNDDIKENSSEQKVSDLTVRPEQAQPNGSINTSEEQKYQKQSNDNQTSQTDKYVGLLWGILIIFISIFFFIKAKQKVRDIAGEDLNLSVDNDIKKSKAKEKSKAQKLVTQIRYADSKYKNNVSNIISTGQNFSVQNPSQTVTESDEVTEIVDLDALFQEHKKQTQIDSEQEENDALDDFLSGFSFYEEDEFNQTTSSEPDFDEEAYKNIINNNSLVFTQKDIDCIGKLLGMEIDDEILNNKDKYLVSNPIKEKSKNFHLEELVSEYAISQNITFTEGDVSIINSLMNVELGSDFISNLRINPDRTKEMEKDILSSKNKPITKSEIITLSVKDMLPNLSEELKRQDNRKVESNYKPKSVNYSEGFTLATLHIRDALPDISKAIQSSQEAPRKEMDIQYVDKNYTVGTKELKTSGALPDLQDVLAHPEKYETQELEPVAVDEEALLKSISNVQFKPFYSAEGEDNEDISSAPSVDDIQEEFKRFGNIEISQDELAEAFPVMPKDNDFNDIYNSEYVDLDKVADNDSNEVLSDKEQETADNLSDSEQKPLTESSPTEHSISKVEDKQKIVSNVKTSSAELKNKKPQIEKSKKPLESKAQKPLQSNKKNVAKVNKNTVAKAKSSIETTKCVLAGEVFNVVNTVELQENIGCHLTHNNSGYTVLGYIGDKTFNIKHFKELRSTKIIARKSERAKDGSERYIIKLGMTKFVISVNKDSINYVMDL